jgi:hypothetical protein
VVQDGEHNTHVPVASDGYDPLGSVHDLGQSALLHTRTNLQLQCKKACTLSSTYSPIVVQRCNSGCHIYQEVAILGEALAVLGRDGDEQSAELADGDDDDTTDDEHPVPVAGGEQLRPDAPVLDEDVVRGGSRLHIEHVVDSLEVQDLEHAGESEQHAHQQRLVASSCVRMRRCSTKMSSVAAHASMSNMW